MTISNDSSRYEKTILVQQSFDVLRLRGKGVNTPPDVAYENRVVANWRYRVM